MSKRKPTSIKLTRIFVHRDPVVFPPWEVIANNFTVGSSHVGAITRVTEAGAFGTIKFENHEVPFFVDMQYLTKGCGPPLVGDMLTVCVASHNEACRQIKFVLANWQAE